MFEHADNSIATTTEGKSNAVSQRKRGVSTAEFATDDQRIDNSFKSQQAAQLQATADTFVDKKQPIQRKNNTGLPDNLKNGVESLSGYSMDDVKVHYNSDKPAQLQAHAYAQGNQIHLAPGQEKHLPHEAWHVVQQKQGRVKPTMQMKGKVNVNDDAGLEKEADVMGAKAMQLKLDTPENIGTLSTSQSLSNLEPVQRAINVNANQEDAKVVIKANGKASEFKDGDSAKNRGWNGVEKYKARVVIGKTRIESGTLNNDYLNAQAGHVLAEQNGGLGSDPNNVFAQDGGVNNGLFRSQFENPMRKELDKVAPNTGVSFRAVLYGKNITQGKLSKISDKVYASSEDSSGTSSDEDDERDDELDEEELTFEEWQNEIGEMAMEEYGLELDDLPDEPYMMEYENGMTPEEFYDEYMANGKAL